MMNDTEFTKWRTKGKLEAQRGNEFFLDERVEGGELELDSLLHHRSVSIDRK